MYTLSCCLSLKLIIKKLNMNFNYSFASLFVVVFAFLWMPGYSQGANVIDFHEKLANLSEVEANELNELVNGSQNAIFINFTNNNPGKHVDPYKGDLVKVMLINSPADFSLLSSTYNEDLRSIKLIDIRWDGKSDFPLDEYILEKMEALEFVIIRSESAFEPDKIKNSFISMIRQIKEGKSTELLFDRLENAQ